MTIDTRTIAELEKDGFSHIRSRCAGCGRGVRMPFRLLLTHELITTATTVIELRSRYRCRGCGTSRATSFGPWRLGDAPDSVGEA
jgi:ribosomal protein S14